MKNRRTLIVSLGVTLVIVLGILVLWMSKTKIVIVDGKDIMELFNVKPGPIIGQTLKALFEAVLDEQVENDRDALLELARTLA